MSVQYSKVLADAKAGKATPDELVQWLNSTTWFEAGVIPTELANVLRAQPSLKHAVQINTDPKSASYGISIQYSQGLWHDPLGKGVLTPSALTMLKRLVEEVPGVKQAEDAANATTSFLGWITSESAWVRIGEFIFGAILLGVGAKAALGQGLGSASKETISQVGAAGAKGSKPFKAFGQYAKDVNTSHGKSGHISYTRDAKGLLT